MNILKGKKHVVGCLVMRMLNQSRLLYGTETKTSSFQITELKKINFKFGRAKTNIPEI